ncbi:MAG: putative phage abortive infection protein [Bacteroidetes bacterium]|nr:putative phage abortive infection protein [Bacteroidota bacterium]
MEIDNDTNTNSFFSERTGKILAVSGLISILIGIVFFIILGSWGFSTVLDEAKIGQFGDFIGGVVGSILALAGIVLYYVALKEQRKEIGVSQNALNCQVEALNQQVEEFREQKKEMQETRKVYDEQTKEFKRQTEISKQQQFDSSFYSLLDVFINLRKELNSKVEHKNYFNEIYGKLKSIVIKDISNFEIFNTINKKYIELYYDNYSELTHYFKTFYQMIKLIETSVVEQAEKEKYFKIFRSQITSCELLLLYYNYHSDLASEVRPLVIKYDLFKDLSILDRIEYGFKGDNYQKSVISSYLNSLINLTVSNLAKYNDLESTTDISISEEIRLFEIQSSLSLEINNKFVLTITLKKEELEKQQFISKDFLNKYISLSIYDALYFSKFRLPQENIIEFEYVEKIQSNSFDYRFIIQNIGSIYT